MESRERRENYVLQRLLCRDGQVEWWVGETLEQGEAARVVACLLPIEEASGEVPQEVLEEMLAQARRLKELPSDAALAHVLRPVSDQPVATADARQAIVYELSQKAVPLTEWLRSQQPDDSERLEVISQVVAAAGVNDIAQGAEMLTHSDDIAVQSALVASLAQEDLELSMKMAAIAGQLEAVGDLALLMDMPTLAEFLDSKSDELQDMAVDTLLRFSATRALSQIMGETSAGIAELGVNEMAEGVVRMSVAEDVADRGEELMDAGAELAAEGLVGAAAAEGFRNAAAELTEQGVSQMAIAGEELGEAEAAGDFADAMEEAAGEA